MKVTPKASRASHEQPMAKGFVAGSSERAMILLLMTVQMKTQHVMSVRMTAHRLAVRVTTVNMIIVLDQGC